MGAPSSQIFLCSGVPLSNRYDHVLMFENKLKQEAYFYSKKVRTTIGYTYLRKNWSIKVQATMEEAEKWNYLYFKNNAQRQEGTETIYVIGKNYYYFIRDIQYVNDATVELSLELDVMQTFQFDMRLPACFVERMHSMTDEPGDNTIDEGLEVGELIVNGTDQFGAFDELCIMILSSIDPNSTLTTNPVPASAYRYNGVFSGLRVYAVEGSKWGSWGMQLDELGDKGFLDGIVSMWMYPKELVVLADGDAWGDSILLKKVASFQLTEDTFSLSVEKNLASVDGYTPDNKKLLTYPYNFLYCSNNQGGSAVYRYEFSAYPNHMYFSMYGSVSPDASMLLVPKGYGVGKSKNYAPNFEEGLSLGNFPTCAWDADVYKMWLAQNQNIHAFTEGQGQMKIVAGAATGIVGGLGSLLMGNVGGALGSLATGATMAVSGAAQIKELLAQQKDMAIQPPQARGRFSATTNVTAGIQNFTFYKKSVSREYARIIDDYFTMYGYKQNRIMAPLQKTRKNYTYVKTVNCLVYGDVPQADAEKISGIFDRGVTLWWYTDENANKIMQYSAGNPLLF